MKNSTNKYVKEAYIILDSWNLEQWQPFRTGCKGRPEIYPSNFIDFCSRLRCVLHLSFRALQGFLEFLQLHLEIPYVPDYSTLWRRIIQKTIVSQQFTTKKYNYLIADSSGMSKTTRSGYLDYKWRTRRDFIKIHFGINEFQEIVFFDVTTEKNGSDSEIALQQLQNLSHIPKRFYGDGGYDRKEIFKLCNELGIKPVIPVRKNAKAKPLAEPLRAKEIKAQKEDLERWKIENDYFLRTAVERAFSSFKRRFGDSCRSLKYELQSVFRMIECFVWLQNLEIT